MYPPTRARRSPAPASASRRRAPSPPIPPAGPSTVPMAATPPPGVPPRAVVRHERESRRRTLGALAVACFLALAAVFGYSIGANHGSNSTSASSNFPTQQQIPQSTRAPATRTGRAASSNGQQANIDVQSIAAKVSPSVVNLVSALERW